MRVRTSAAALAAGFAALSSVSDVSFGAALPLPYTVQLQARASVGSGATTFNLPAGSSFTSATPDINNKQQVAFKLITSGTSGRQGIWYGQANAANSFGSGGVLSTAPDANASLSDPTVNNGGDVIWPQTSGSTQNGIWKYNATTTNTALLTNGPLGASSWANPRINDIGQLGTRVSFSSGQAYVSFDPTGTTTAVHAADVAAQSSSPYSFLSTGNFDNSRRIAGRVNLGATFNNTNPDQIRLFNADGSSSLIAEDKESNAAALFTQFDNTQPGQNDNGFVAFISRTTTAAASRSVFLSNGTTTTTIAAPGMATTAGTTITSIDNFSPNVNNSNLVVFRATDSAGTIGVFVGDGTTLQRIARIGDTVHTDIGDFAINSLGGNPTINDFGDVAFGGGLGAGGNFVAVALVPEPGMIGVAGVIGAGVVLRRRKR